MPEHTPGRYAVIGFPVGHSQSPLIHRLFAEQTAQNIVTYTRLGRETGAEFKQCRAALRGRRGGTGLNVTVPHKEAAFELADVIGPEAERAGAVNTLSFSEDGRMVRGDNTDGAGFRRDIERNNGISPRCAKRTHGATGSRVAPPGASLRCCCDIGQRAE